MPISVVPTSTSTSAGSTSAGARPDPEVSERARRRRFTAEYKMAIVREADACTEPGQIGALLRREGLYSSHLVDWRRARDQAAARELAARRRGRKPASAAEAENVKLRKDNQRLRRELTKAHTVIDVLGKVSALLGIDLESADPRTDA